MVVELQTSFFVACGACGTGCPSLEAQNDNRCLFLILWTGPEYEYITIPADSSREAYATD